MSTANELLQELGFSQYEAQAYVTLLRKNPLNGYELAKESGIPRANIYLVLQKLEERGAVLRQDSPEGTFFAPVAADELLNQLHHRFDHHLASARTALEQLQNPADLEQIWNLRGYQAVLDHAASLIQGSERELLLAVWPQEAVQLGEPAAQAEQRGVRITTLCLAGCPQPCGSCRGEIHMEPPASEVLPAEPAARWLVLVPDQGELLAGEIGAESQTLAVRTKQRLLVSLAGGYIRSQLALAHLVNDLGSRLNQLLGESSRQMLITWGAGRSQSGWLEHLRQILTSTEDSNRD